jgi:hypothetical protein
MPRDRRMTDGEARTLLGMVAGVDPEPVESFILISVLKCADCGESHRLVMDRDLGTDDALTILNSAVGLVVMAQYRKDATGRDDIYGQS